MARILIIEDDDLVRALLVNALGRAGHEVLKAADGQEGIKLYRAAPTDLVITDLIMPEKEGIETIIELRRDFPQARIIAISGGGKFDNNDYLRIARAVGAKRAIDKPFKIEELLRAVEEVLGQPDDLPPAA